MDVTYIDNEGYTHIEVMSLDEYERRIALPKSNKDSLAFTLKGDK